MTTSISTARSASSALLELSRPAKKRKTKDPEKNAVNHILKNLCTSLQTGRDKDIFNIANSILNNPKLTESLGLIANTNGNTIKQAIKFYIRKTPNCSEGRIELGFSLIYGEILRDSSHLQTALELEKSIFEYCCLSNPQNMQSILDESSQYINRSPESLAPNNIKEIKSYLETIEKISGLYYFLEIKHQLKTIINNSRSSLEESQFSNCFTFFDLLCDNLTEAQETKEDLLQVKWKLYRLLQEHLQISKPQIPQNNRTSLLKHYAVDLWNVGTQYISETLHRTLLLRSESSPSPSPFKTAVNNIHIAENLPGQSTFDYLIAHPEFQMPPSFVNAVLESYFNVQKIEDFADFMNFWAMNLSPLKFEKLKNIFKIPQRETRESLIYSFVQAELGSKSNFITLKKWVDRTSP